MNTVEIEDLSFTYPGASQPTLLNVTFTIEKGDFLAIVGNNGCGKSTLCKVINGLIPHFIVGDMQGNVRVCDMDTRTSDVGTLAQKVGYVYQDFENQIVRPTVLDDASYACLNFAFKDYEERGRRALALCGLEGLDDEYVWQLSGGQTHLLALAGAVSLQPDVIILDEPIAQLDPKHADAIYEVLKDLNENHGKTIVVIEHHTEYIADYCKHVLLLKDGTVRWKLPAHEALRRVEELEASDIFPPQVTQAAHRFKVTGSLAHVETLPTTVDEGKAAFASLKRDTHGNDANQMTDTPAVDGEASRGNTSDAASSSAAPAEPESESDAPDALASSAAPEDASNMPSVPAVEFNDVTLGYRSVKGDRHVVLDHFDLSINEGEKIALIGSNGAGKSTIMKLMVGLLKPAAGTVSLFGSPIGNKKAEEISRQISLVYQNPEEMFIKDSIENDISFAMRVRDVPQWEEKTAQLLERFRLTDLRNRDGRLMSGGQMRRASLAIGIALNPSILLLDEPTANLDIATRREIMAVLDDMKDIIKTAVIATHDMQLVCQWAERIIVLCGGKVVADGTREEVFGDKRLAQLVGIRPPEIFTMARALDDDARCFTVDEFVSGFKEA